MNIDHYVTDDERPDTRAGSHIHPDYIHANPDRSIPWPAVVVVFFGIAFVAAVVLLD